MNKNKEISDVMEVFANSMVVTILQYTNVSNQHAVYFNLT